MFNWKINQEISDVESVKLRIIFEYCGGIVWKLVITKEISCIKWLIKNVCKIEYQMIYYWHNKKQDGDRTLQ